MLMVRVISWTMREISLLHRAFRFTKFYLYQRCTCF